MINVRSLRNRLIRYTVSFHFKFQFCKSVELDWILVWFKISRKCPSQNVQMHAKINIWQLKLDQFKHAYIMLISLDVFCVFSNSWALTSNQKWLRTEHARFTVLFAWTNWVIHVQLKFHTCTFIYALKMIPFKVAVRHYGLSSCCYSVKRSFSLTFTSKSTVCNHFHFVLQLHHTYSTKHLCMYICYISWKTLQKRGQ